MRTLMLIASIAMIGTGVFCVANGSVAFLTVAFVIGLMFCVMGALEAVIGTRADFSVSEQAVGIIKDGVIMMIFGVVIISGQVADDLTALMLFAMWLVTEGILSFRGENIDIMHVPVDQRLFLSLSALMVAGGVYMFFNFALFNLPVILLIGFGMIMLGLRRFLQSFEIEYTRPGFITGNEEKLQGALEEEKRALAKAKEGIREQKIAQRRIRKIREDIAAEQDVMNSAAIRRAERALERDEDN